MKQAVPMIQCDPSWTCSSHSALKTWSKGRTALFSCCGNFDMIWLIWPLKSPQDQANSDLPGSRSLSFWQLGLNSDPLWNSIEIFQHLLWKGNSMGQKLLLQPEINFAPRCSASAFVPDTWQHKIRSLSHWQDDPGLQIWYDLKQVRDSKIKCQNSATQLF